MSSLVKNRPSQQEVFPSVTREALRKNPNASEVAEELGLHISTVYRHSEGMDLGLIKRMRKLSIDNKDMIYFLCEDMGFGKKEAAKRLGFSLAYVSQVLSDQDSEAA